LAQGGHLLSPALGGSLWHIRLLVSEEEEPG